MPTTPERALQRITEHFGEHPGHRALHAKGVHCVGTWTPTPEAGKLTRAAHMQAPVPAKVRFSNGRGDPTVPDYVPDVRGLAVSFQLPDGAATDILSQTTPRFPFRDHEGVLDVMPIAERSLTTLIRLPLFLAKHPKALLTMGEATAAVNSRASFAARRYFPFHAFKWIDAAGGERWIRYYWHPTVDEAEPSKEEVRRRGPDYLFDELRERLSREPVRMRLEVKIAAGDDDPHDPSSVWPDDRERVTVGTLEVTSIDDDADDGIVYDPMRLTDGIEGSNDPALRYRPAVYSLSHARRTGS
jgi:catalase